MPVIPAVTVLKVRVPLVAPAMVVKVVPPSVLCCHCTLGLGAPLAAALKVAVLSTLTVWLVGWVVIAGPAVIVSVKLWLAAGLTPLLAVIVMG